MGKNVSKKASRQQGNVKSGLSQALGEFVRESLYDTVLVSGLAHVPHVPVEDVKRFLAHQARARRLINRLGERGYRQLKDLLDENGGANG